MENPNPNDFLPDILFESDELFQVRSALVACEKVLKNKMKDSKQSVLQHSDNENQLLHDEIKQFQDRVENLQNRQNNQPHAPMNELIDFRTNLVHFEQKFQRIKYFSIMFFVLAFGIIVAHPFYKSQQEVSLSSDFRSGLSESMASVLNKPVWMSMKPLVADHKGEYPLVNWKENNEFWFSQWKLIVNKNSNGQLHFPPILLPAELNGWLIVFFIQYKNNENSIENELFQDEENNKLNLFGGILSVDHHHQHNQQNSPKQTKVYFEMEFYFDGLKMVAINKIFHLQKSINLTNNLQHWHSLTTIQLNSFHLYNNYPLPTILIRVKKIMK